MKQIILVPIMLQVAVRLPTELQDAQLEKVREAYGAWLFRRAMAEMEYACRELESEEPN